MSDRHAAPNISIASLDGDRKEPFRRSLFSIPGQARDAVAKPISSKGSAAPLKKRQVRLTSIEDNNHARPLVTYHEDPPLNETWSPIPFQTSPEEEEGMIMSGVMEDFKCLMDGVFLEAKELPKLDSPSDIDVICPKGGGKKVLSHPGNKYYSKLIEEAVLAHICDKPDEDPNIFDVATAARIIVKQIRSRNSKFLYKDQKENSTWRDIGDDTAVRKTILRFTKAHKQALENKTKAQVEKKAQASSPVEAKEPRKRENAIGTWSPKTVEDVMQVLVIPPRPSPRPLNRKMSVRSSSSPWRARKGSKSNATPKRGEPQSCLPSPVVSSHSLVPLLPSPAGGTVPSPPPMLSRGRSRSFKNLFKASLVGVPSQPNLELSPRDLSSRPKLKRKRSSSLPNMGQRVAIPPGRHSYHGTEEPVPMDVSSSLAFENMTVWAMAEHLLSQDLSSNLHGSV